MFLIRRARQAPRSSLLAQPELDTGDSGSPCGSRRPDVHRALASAIVLLTSDHGGVELTQQLRNAIASQCSDRQGRQNQRCRHSSS